MNSFLKFRLLVWKNFLIQKRKPITTAFELGLPLLFAIVMMVTRVLLKPISCDKPTLWMPCAYEELWKGFKDMKLAYSPANKATERVMKTVEGSLGIQTEGFSNEKEMTTFITRVNSTVNNSRIYLGGVPFENNFNAVGGIVKYQFDKQVTYKIRLSYSPRYPETNKTGIKRAVSWMTNFMFPLMQSDDIRQVDSTCSGEPGYEREGFLAIQKAVNDALMKETLSAEKFKEFNSTKVRLRRHPYPTFKQHNYIPLPLFWGFGMIIPVFGMIKDILLEKERKLKETMKMMGIDNWLHWAGWFAKSFLFLMIIPLIYTMLFGVQVHVTPETEAAINPINIFIVFLFLMCYAVAIITYCFAVSAVFAKATTGARFGGFLFFVALIFAVILTPETMSLRQKLFQCAINFQASMVFGAKIIGDFEELGSSITCDTLHQGPNEQDNFSMLLIMSMLLVNSAAYFLFAWYVEAVFPGNFGVPLPWNFPFTNSYWRCKKQQVEYDIDLQSTNDVGHDPEMFQEEENVPVAIKILNLRKVYSGGFGFRQKEKVAVAGMTLNMYEGQITALLGNSSAGKTTTMLMLSGFYPPTSGTAIVDGHHIQTEMPEIRNSLGLCPQHDVLFDNLTVEEHMVFFGLLKGVKQVIPEYEEMLTDMELYEKLKKKVKTLSGGMKRQLSVCIALIGNSKIVVLDEPSSGVDPGSRLNIWTVLEKNRKGRTIILSTNSMEEADLLGDRIAIMAGGVVQCCGCSSFLKYKYRAGYNMVLIITPDCVVSKVEDLVKSHIPTAELEANAEDELNFVLPKTFVHEFAALFAEIEQKQEELGISSFGNCVTSMEEVFLRAEETQYSVADVLPEAEETQYSVAEVLPDTETGSKQLDLFLDPNHMMNKNIGLILFLQQFYAMLLKRILHSCRNKVVTILQLAIPLVVTVLAIVQANSHPSFVELTSLKLSPDVFDVNYIPYHDKKTPTSDMATTYKNQFKNSSYVTSFDVADDKRVIWIRLVDYLVYTGKRNIPLYNMKYMIAAEFFHDSTVVAYFNNQAFHSIAISLAAAYNGLYKYFHDSEEFGIETYNHPLPRLDENKVGDTLRNKETKGFVIAFNLAIGMSFLSGTFVVFLVKERSSKAKLIQFISGVHPVNFWFSTFCWDMINLLVSCLVILVVFRAFSIDHLTEDLHLLELFVFFFMYGWGMLPFMYFFSFAFNVAAAAFVVISLFNAFTAIVTLLLMVFLTNPIVDWLALANALDYVFIALLPNYGLARGLNQFYDNTDNIKWCKPLRRFIDCTPDTPENLKFCCRDLCGYNCMHYNYDFLGWEKNGIGQILLVQFLQGVVLWGLVFMYEYGLIRKLLYFMLPRQPPPPLMRKTIADQDVDVIDEKIRIQSTPSEQLFVTDKLIIEGLTKQYGQFLAVNRISVGIPTGECFGLLGYNGAGKTTTIKMLIGDDEINYGNAYVDSYCLKTEKHMAWKRLGYCPQFDALIGHMTARETLFLYSRLRGVPKTQIPWNVKNIMDALTLTPYADKMCKTYSGCNMRKLSIAIALIGDPEVVFLDEPTTGMDPVTRRMLWLVLSKVRDSGRTLVLTSHSMEECEALCTTLAIMVSGEFKCVGSIQYLKTKFGEGYTLKCKIRPPEDENPLTLVPLKRFLESTFQHSTLMDAHENTVSYHIIDRELNWAQVIEKLEMAKKQLKIQDYMVSQITLERVFLNFARIQIQDVDFLKGLQRTTNVLSNSIRGEGIITESDLNVYQEEGDELESNVDGQSIKFNRASQEERGEFESNVDGQ